MTLSQRVAVKNPVTMLPSINMPLETASLTGNVISLQYAKPMLTVGIHAKPYDQ